MKQFNKSIRVVKCLFLSTVLFVSSAYAKTPEKKATNDETKALIEDLYKDINGYTIGSEETSMIEKEGGAPTYGEITYEAAKEILDDLTLTAKDVVYDLGSGTGRFATQIYLTTPAKKVIGIELSPTRVEQANSVKEALKKQSKLKRNQLLEFRKENIISAPIKDATVVYSCSTCFSDDLMNTIVKKLSQIKRKIKILTLQQLPENKFFKLIKEYSLPMTWSNDVPVYLYERN